MTSIEKVSNLKDRYRSNMLSAETESERERWQAKLDDLIDFERESKTDRD